jgi:hypothetical protein
MRHFLLSAIIVFTVGLWAVANAQTTYEHDIAFESLIGADTIRYAVGTTVPLQARFINSGTSDVDTVRLKVTLFDVHGMIIHMNVIEVSTRWQSSASLDTLIGRWYPTLPGTYYAEYCSMLKGDENTDNDCSARYAHTFLTVVDSSIAAGSPTKDMHQPLMDKSYPAGEPVPIEIPFANLGRTETLTDVPLRARISSNKGDFVYDRTVMATLEPGITSTVKFPDFLLPAPGTYCLTAWSSYGRDDVPENDTVSWCFTVVESTAGVGSDILSASKLQLSVIPNPASHTVKISYSTYGERATAIILHNGDGEIARTVPIISGSDTGTLNLDIEDLPSGAYSLQLVIPNGAGTTARMIIQN